MILLLPVVLAIIVPIGLVVGVLCFWFFFIRSAVASGVRDAGRSPAPSPFARPAPPPLPAPPAGPGRYRVVGVDRESRMDTTWYCHADNSENARVKAELEGIVVTVVQLATASE